MPSMHIPARVILRSQTKTCRKRGRNRMPVFQENGAGRGYRFVWRVYRQEDGNEREIVCTCGGPEEASYMIEELRDVYGQGYKFWWSREKEMVCG